MLFQHRFLYLFVYMVIYLVDEIYEHITDKIGDEDNGFVHALLEMYSETVNTLTDNKPSDEGNAATWKVTKG